MHLCYGVSMDSAALVACAHLFAVLQIYKAERAGWPVRVYNLLYEDSQEADKFAIAVAREVLSLSLCHSGIFLCRYLC